MKPDEKGKQLANDILDYVNNLAFDEESFASTICSAHRTLQQSTMRLFIATICKMAENDTDAAKISIRRSVNRGATLSYI